jgi:hypothetical protein
MKYQEMTDIQKTAYKAKQVENQRLARIRAKQNTTVINLTINNCTPELVEAIIKSMETK